MLDKGYLEIELEVYVCKLCLFSFCKVRWVIIILWIVIGREEKNIFVLFVLVLLVGVFKLG